MAKLSTMNKRHRRAAMGEYAPRKNPSSRWYAERWINCYRGRLRREEQEEREALDSRV